MLHEGMMRVVFLLAGVWLLPAALGFAADHINIAAGERFEYPERNFFYCATDWF